MSRRITGPPIDEVLAAHYRPGDFHLCSTLQGCHRQEEGSTTERKEDSEADNKRDGLRERSGQGGIQGRTAYPSQPTNPNRSQGASWRFCLRPR